VRGPARFHLIGLAVFLLIGGNVLAFKIDPEVRPEAAFKDRYSVFLDHFLYPVHERMAAMSYLCAQNQQDGEPCPGDKGLKPPGFDGSEDLFHGTRWNDDPNNSFPSDHGVTWVFWMGDADRLSRAKGIQKIDPLQYRSHYGDLQFLHAMAQKADRNAVTKARILDWSHFAYAVAVGEIPPTAMLQSLSRDYPFVQNFAGLSKKRSWTVRRLFLNVEDYKGGELTGVADSSVPMIALGALLHTLQDSYSSSHTSRSFPATDDAAQSGSIQSFLDYAQQKSECHSPSDLAVGWLVDGGTKATDNPVYHGAWVVRRVLRKAPWTEVGPYLDSVYSVTDGMGLPTGGGFDDCPGTTTGPSVLSPGTG